MSDLSQFSNKELRQELERREQSVLDPNIPETWPQDGYGIWEVSTEGDCEGRTTKALGIYKGHIGDIALILQPEATYSLNFKHITVTQIGEQTQGAQERNNVNVLGLGLDFTGDKEALVKVMQKVLGSRFKVVKSPYYNSVTINLSSSNLS